MFFSSEQGGRFVIVPACKVPDKRHMNLVLTGVNLEDFGIFPLPSVPKPEGCAGDGDFHH